MIAGDFVKIEIYVRDANYKWLHVKAVENVVTTHNKVKNFNISYDYTATIIVHQELQTSKIFEY